MNEHIKELWQRAAKIHSGDSWAEQTAFLNKFAELIVRECAKVINADIEAQTKDGVISNIHGLNQARYLINEHFGVEE